MNFNTPAAQQVQFPDGDVSDNFTQTNHAEGIYNFSASFGYRLDGHGNNVDNKRVEAYFYGKMMQ